METTENWLAKAEEILIREDLAYTQYLPTSVRFEKRRAERLAEYLSTVKDLRDVVIVFSNNIESPVKAKTWESFVRIGSRNEGTRSKKIQKYIFAGVKK